MRIYKLTLLLFSYSAFQLHVFADIIPLNIDIKCINKKGHYVSCPKANYKPEQKKENKIPNLAPYKGENGLYGYGIYDIEKKTYTEVIKPQFAQVAGISFDGEVQSVAMYTSTPKNPKWNVNPKNMKWGVIDRKGNWVIKPVADRALVFFDGTAQIVIDGKYGLVNEKGEYIVKPDFDYVGYYSEGLALAGVDKKWGYIDKNGKWAIKPQFPSAVCVGNFRRCNSSSNFKDGIAPIIYDIEEYEVNGQKFKRNKVGFINKKGELILKGYYGIVGNFSEGLAFAADKDGKYGYINKSGKWVIKPKFHRAESFHEGIAWVEIKLNDMQMRLKYPTHRRK